MFNNIIGTTFKKFFLGKKREVVINNNDGNATYEDKYYPERSFDMTRNYVVGSSYIVIPNGFTMFVTSGFKVDGDLIADGDLCEV
jgi:hypothetical protein